MKKLFKLICVVIALFAFSPAQSVNAKATVYFTNSSKYSYYDITLAIDGKDIKTFDAPYKNEKEVYNTITTNGVTEIVESRKLYYQKIEMPAGTHTFKIYFSWFGNDFQATQELEIKDGETYYLKYGYSRKGAKIDVLDAKKGAEELEKMNKKKDIFVFPDIIL